eukprot:366336-Chlamydomonas_euryale.AAC.35
MVAGPVLSAIYPVTHETILGAIELILMKLLQPLKNHSFHKTCLASKTFEGRARSQRHGIDGESYRGTVSPQPTLNTSLRLPPKATPLCRCIYRLFIDEGGQPVHNWAAQLEAFPAERPDSGGAAAAAAVGGPAHAMVGLGRRALRRAASAVAVVGARWARGVGLRAYASWGTRDYGVRARAARLAGCARERHMAGAELDVRRAGAGQGGRGRGTRRAAWAPGAHVCGADTAGVPAAGRDGQPGDARAAAACAAAAGARVGAAAAAGRAGRAVAERERRRRGALLDAADRPASKAGAHCRMRAHVVHVFARRCADQVVAAVLRWWWWVVAVVVREPVSSHLGFYTLPSETWAVGPWGPLTTRRPPPPASSSCSQLGSVHTTSAAHAPQTWSFPCAADVVLPMRRRRRPSLVPQTWSFPCAADVVLPMCRRR